VHGPPTPAGVKGYSHGWSPGRAGAQPVEHDHPHFLAPAGAKEDQGGNGVGWIITPSVEPTNQQDAPPDKAGLQPAAPVCHRLQSVVIPPTKYPKPGFSRSSPQTSPQTQGLFFLYFDFLTFQHFDVSKEQGARL